MIKTILYNCYYSTLVDKMFTTYEEAKNAEGDFYQKVMSIANDIHNVVEDYNKLAKEYEKVRLSKDAIGSTMKVSEIASFERKFDAMVKALYEAGVCKLDTNISDNIDKYANSIEDDDDETVTTERLPKRVVVKVRRVKRCADKPLSTPKIDDYAECEGCSRLESCKVRN